MDFLRSKADDSLYVHKDSSILILVYVDDLAIIGQKGRIIEIKQKLSKEFKMKDLEEMGLFLGCEITRDGALKTISLLQEKYLDDILEGQGMCECNGVETPLPQDLLIKSHEKDDNSQVVEIADQSKYQRVVGQILFALLFTRPDLSHAIEVISCHSHAPGETAWKAVKHLLRYIKKTKEEKLILGRVKYADLGGDIETRRLIIGVVCYGE